LLNDEKSLPKGKSFSISHYDIYNKPSGFLLNRRGLQVSRRREMSKDEKTSEKESSLVESEFHKELVEEKPH
jgi:hypothetical protein